MENIDDVSIKLFAERISAQRKRESNIILNMLHDSQYMDQLVKKINEDTCVYENINSNDNKLSLLYKIVDNYAKENGLSPIVMPYYSIYYVEYNGCRFSVFKKSKDNEVGYGCYISYLKEEQMPYCINYQDIVNNKSIDANSFTAGLIAELKNHIEKMHAEGLPVYFIRQLVDNIVDDLEKEKMNGKVK